MRVIKSSYAFLDDMAGAGNNVYVDIAGNVEQGHSLFMLTEDGNVERAYWNGSAWTNEVLLVGDYTAIAQGDETHEIFAIQGEEPAYALWKTQHGIVDPLADDDGDGLDNLSEFGLGGNPNDPQDLGYATSTELSGSSLNYVYPMRSGNSGIAYYLETKDNLIFGVWTNAGYAALGTAMDGYASGFDAVTNQISTTNDQQFIRLMIEEL